MLQTDQAHQIPDLSVLMENTPHDNGSHTQKKHGEFSPLLLGSVALLFIFSLASLGIIVANNNQTATTETRSQAAALGDLMNTTQVQACQNVIFYKNNQAVAVNTLKPGDTVDIAIMAGTAAKAQFSINQGTAVETQTKNAAGEFVYQYTFPQNMTNVVIRAALIP